MTEKTVYGQTLNRAVPSCHHHPPFSTPLVPGCAESFNTDKIGRIDVLSTFREPPFLAVHDAIFRHFINRPVRLRQASPFWRVGGTLFLTESIKDPVIIFWIVLRQSFLWLNSVRDRPAPSSRFRGGCLTGEPTRVGIVRTALSQNPLGLFRKRCRR
jgi:hypothetical protein